MIGGRTSNLLGLALRGEGLGKSVFLMVSLTGSNLVADLKMVSLYYCKKATRSNLTLQTFTSEKLSGLNSGLSRWSMQHDTSL